MLQMLGAVAPLAKILFSTIEKSVPDKDLQAKLKSDLQTQLLQSNTQELQAAAKIIEAEAKAGWFASSWRPLLMYVLIFILVWNYIFGPIVKFFFACKSLSGTDFSIVENKILARGATAPNICNIYISHFLTKLASSSHLLGVCLYHAEFNISAAALV